MTDRISLADDMRRRYGQHANLPPADEQQPAAADAEQPVPADDLSPEVYRLLIQSERQRAAGIVRAAEQAGRMDLAGSLIQSGRSLAACRKTLDRARPAARTPGRA